MAKEIELKEKNLPKFDKKINSNIEELIRSNPYISC